MLIETARKVGAGITWVSALLTAIMVKQRTLIEKVHLEERRKNG
jgi:methanogenic corrinoid protein MtbC1